MSVAKETDDFQGRYYLVGTTVVRMPSRRQLEFENAASAAAQLRNATSTEASRPAMGFSRRFLRFLGRNIGLGKGRGAMPSNEPA